MHLCLLLFAVFSTLVIPSFSQSCGLGLKASAVDFGNATMYHNKYRTMLNEGKVPNQPKAKHVDDLKLDIALAQEALKIATTCKYGHVKVSDPRWKSVGQNIFKKCGTVSSGQEEGYDDAVKAWYDEHNDYHYSEITGNHGGPKVLHYTQLMWQNTKHVGCAHSRWEDMRGTKRWTCTYVVCNYGPAGNFVGEKPYEVALNQIQMDENRYVASNYGTLRN